MRRQGGELALRRPGGFDRKVSSAEREELIAALQPERKVDVYRRERGSGRPRPDPTPRLDEERWAILRRPVLDVPDVEAIGMSAWTLGGLCREVEARWGWGVRYHEGHMGKLVRSLGLLRQKTRKGYPKADPAAREAFAKGGLQAALDAARAAYPGKRLTLWFQDEARFAQKGASATAGSPAAGRRPPGLSDQRCAWAHLFAAVRPVTSDAFALVLPRVSTHAMQAFLDRFARRLAADEHAALVLDRAGWHVSRACPATSPS